MATMFGRFEIQSELLKSDTALIYKAMDTDAPRRTTPKLRPSTSGFPMEWSGGTPPALRRSGPNTALRVSLGVSTSPRCST